MRLHTQKFESKSTYRFEDVDLLHRASENGPVLLEVLMHHFVARSAAFADGLHLDLHLPNVLASMPGHQSPTSHLLLSGGMVC